MEFSYLNASQTRTEKIDKSNFYMHTHDFYEIYCFLEGEANYSVEGVIYPLEPGDVILLRKGEAHYLLPDESFPYERIAVHFDFKNIDDDYISKRLLSVFNDRPLGKFNRYPAEIFTDMKPLYYLKKICDSTNDSQKIISILALLEELYEKFEFVKQDPFEHLTDNSSDILRYINRHLTDDLSLKNLCKHFFVSKSQLNRNFKKANGSTIWEYITVKRLLLAKEMLKNGGRPTKIYLECGFNDYVTFFKAYKKPCFLGFGAVYSGFYASCKCGR